MKQTRYSKQREIIWENLTARRDHPSAEMIYQSLKPQHPALSLGTVYRNLNLLVSEGRALRIPFATDRFDGSVHQHPHFLCTCCGNLTDLDLPTDEALNRAVEALGHQVTRHDLIFKGSCPHCKGKGLEEAPAAVPGH